MERHLNFFTDNLPTQSNCSAFTDIWPKSGICTNNAIGCLIPNSTHNDPSTYSCVCAEGWTGKGDYISLGNQDCHLRESVLNTYLYTFRIVGVVNVVLMSLWCYHQFVEAFHAIKGRKTPKAKTLAYLIWMLCESIVCVGLGYRIKSGNRFGFDPLATMFLAMILTTFMAGAYLFVATWARMALASVSMETSKQETKERANKICRNLKYEMTITQVIQSLCYIGIATVNEEVSETRNILTTVAVTCTSVDCLSLIFCLVKCGQILTGAVAKGDDQLKKMGAIFLRVIYTISFIGITCAVVFILLAFVPILSSYQAYIFTLALCIGGSVPVIVVLLLEKASWLKDLNIYLKKSQKVSPGKNDNSVTQHSTVTSEADGNKGVGP